MQAIDTNQFLEKAAGNPNLAKEVFRLLMAELPEHQGRIESATHHRNWQQLGEEVHSLRGAIAYGGVPALRQAADATQAQLRAGDPQALPAQVAQLLQEIERLLAVGREQDPARLFQG